MNSQNGTILLRKTNVDEKRSKITFRAGRGKRGTRLITKAKEAATMPRAWGTEGKNNAEVIKKGDAMKAKPSGPDV